MDQIPKLYISASGMITAVGDNTITTAAALRAGISAYQETDYYTKKFDRVRMATVPESVLEGCLNEAVLKGDFSALRARQLQLISLSLLELASSIPKDTAIPLFLVGPEAAPDDEVSINNVFLENAALQSGLRLDIANSRIISTGRAGGLAAIKLAFRYFENSAFDYVLVGGVDTAYDQSVVDLFDSDDRLLCGDAMDGFVPGEGAGVLLLTKNKHGSPTPCTCIYEPGIGEEKGHMFSEEPYTGTGLSNAVSMAIANSGNNLSVQTIYSSMNGESFFAKEYGVASIRNSGHFHNNALHVHPADCMGDLGAATGTVFIGLIDAYIKAGQIEPPILLYCSSDKEHRMAAIIHKA